jgi:hypothetical protein
MFGDARHADSFWVTKQLRARLSNLGDYSMTAALAGCLSFPARCVAVGHNLLHGQAVSFFNGATAAGFASLIWHARHDGFADCNGTLRISGLARRSRHARTPRVTVSRQARFAGGTLISGALDWKWHA